MSYAWKPNRDSGSVRFHRNPNTRRRYQRSDVGFAHFKANNGRAAFAAFMRQAQPELRTGLFDVSIARVLRGWDAGDPMGNGNPQLVEAVPDFYDEEVLGEFDFIYEGCSCGDPFCEYA